MPQRSYTAKADVGLALKAAFDGKRPALRFEAASLHGREIGHAGFGCGNTVQNLRKLAVYAFRPPLAAQAA